MESLGLDLNKGLIPYIKYIHLVVLLLVLFDVGALIQFIQLTENILHLDQIIPIKL